MSEETEKGIEGASKLGFGSLRPGGVVIDFRKFPSLETLEKVIAKLVQLHGCRACGLAGLDVALRAPTLELAHFEEFEEIGAIRRVGGVFP